MVGKTTRGVYMDAEQLKKMDASEAVWLAVHLCGKRRRELEEELELVPGQIDRWSSRKDHHTPSLATLPELVEATSAGDPRENVMLQWLLARVADKNLLYDRQRMGISEMERNMLHLGAEFGQVAIHVLSATTDGAIDRTEAMRIKSAAADVMARCQTILSGVEPYI